MADRPVLGPREDLVALLFVEPGGLDAEAGEVGVAVAPFHRAPLRGQEEPPAVAQSAQARGDPEDAHEEDAAPDPGEQSAHDLVRGVPEEEIDRRVLAEPGDP